MSDKKSRGNVKKRHWACVVYPESAPQDWREILRQTGLQCAISPLHDADVRADESEKKAHWHVILCWTGPTTYSVACAVTERLNAPAPQALDSVKGYYRYLTHKDDPDKVQYDEADIELIGGFDIRDYVEMTRSEIFAIKEQIQAYIIERDIVEYATLLDMLRADGERDMLDVAYNNTVFCAAYLTSRRYIREKYMRDCGSAGGIIVDTETGEVTEAQT